MVYDEVKRRKRRKKEETKKLHCFINNHPLDSYIDRHDVMLFDVKGETPI